MVRERERGMRGGKKERERDKVKDSREESEED